MKILAIIGSQRAGNTLKAARELEKEMLKLDSSVEFEYIKLWQLDIKLCLGCFQCLKNGIENCPLQDDMTQIIATMMEADGIILASPVYVMNVTANMKNFLDRLAAFCHRPAFFRQKVLVLSTVGGFGIKKVLNYLKDAAEVIGMQSAVKLGLTTPPLPELPESLQAKNRKLTEQAAHKYRQVLLTKGLIPSLSSVVQFEAQKVIFASEQSSVSMPADRTFYAALQNSNYWVPAKIAWYKTLIGKTAAKLIAFFMK